MGIKIMDINAYNPTQKVSNEQLIEKIFIKNATVNATLLEKCFGSKNRYYAEEKEQVSDMAVKAASPILERNKAINVDFLIFASASADVIEPTTASIIQYKLGLNCPCIDVKNACNSFVSALELAKSLILSNVYQNILIVSSEKLSDTLKKNYETQEDFAQNSIATTFGDAASAVLVCYEDSESNILRQKFRTKGEFWELCAVKGGGSLFPHNVDKTYFEGHGMALQNVVEQYFVPFFEENFSKIEWSKDDIKGVFTHQVSGRTIKQLSSALQMDENLFFPTFETYGNIAAVSIPMALHLANKKGMIKRGDKIILIGLAAGVSFSVNFLIW